MLFALTLLGVAFFHRHTLTVAMPGLAGSSSTSWPSGFNFAPGIGASACTSPRMGDPHQSVPAVPGFCAAVAAFRAEPNSRTPAALLPDNWNGGLVLLVHGVRAVGLPRQHRGRDDRRHDGAARLPGQGPYRLSRRHRRRLECRRRRQRHRRHHDHHDVDRGRPPLAVLEAYVAAGVAILIFAMPAAKQQHPTRRFVKRRRRD